MSDLVDTCKPVPTKLVMLIEDEPGDRELLAIALARGKYPCSLVTASDGQEALRYLRGDPADVSAGISAVSDTAGPAAGGTTRRPDLIILDLNLPGISGREILAAIKKAEHLQSIPVIILSTSCDERDVAGTYALGAASYVVKPGNFRDFSRIVSSLLDYWLSAVTLAGYN